MIEDHYPTRKVINEQRVLPVADNKYWVSIQNLKVGGVPNVQRVWAGTRINIGQRDTLFDLSRLIIQSVHDGAVT